MMSSSALADEILVELSPEQPYVDVTIEAVEPTTVTITTNTGTPQTPGFIDSWVELWQNDVRLGYNDDGAHSSTNFLASLLTMPIDAGLYIIKATSYAWAVTNGNQTPTGSYTLNWSGAPSVSPTPSETPTPEPEPSQSETAEPTFSPTPEISPTVLPSPEPTATDSSTSTPEQSNSETITPSVTPSLPTDLPSDLLDEQINDSETVAELPSDIQSEELEILPDLEALDESSLDTPISEQRIELSVSPIFEDIPGAEQLLAAVESVLNVGSDMTPAQREESQSVVIAAVLVQQIAQLSAVGSISRRHK
jgi:hypothetical protein